jgi:hypothetical protein
MRGAAVPHRVMPVEVAEVDVVGLLCGWSYFLGLCRYAVPNLYPVGDGEYPCASHDGQAQAWFCLK